MNVIGLDLSLTGTGVATHDGRLLTLKVRGVGPTRLREIRELIVAHTWEMTSPRHPARRRGVVVLEGYSYNSKGRATYGIAELGGVIRLALHDHRIPYVEIPPSVLKKYATGKGTASKDAVLVAAVKRLDIEPADNNQADAAWLRAMGLDAYGEAPVRMPVVQRDQLTRVAWPTLQEGAA